jgi:hypothetical protein
VRALQLQEMGFSKIQSENSIKQYQTIEAALEAILSFANNKSKTNSLFLSLSLQLTNSFLKIIQMKMMKIKIIII